jgi:ABC-type dipeptide/oligopeptide/nickel transport system ATPase component
MQILRLSYTDKLRSVTIHPIEFQNITLLVGVSGVGKTQIINAITTLQSIAAGDAINGAKWEIDFKSSDGRLYKWIGEFDTLKGLYEKLPKHTDDEPVKKKPAIEVEELYVNNELLIERESNNIIFKGVPTIKLSKHESIISLLREEEMVFPAYRGFKKIKLSSNSGDVKEAMYLPGIKYIKELENQYSEIESVKELEETL